MKFAVYPAAAALEACRTLPRLSPEEYGSFVMALLARADPAKVIRQKELEKRIEVPFTLAEVRIKLEISHRDHGEHRGAAAEQQ